MTFARSGAAVAIVGMGCTRFGDHWDRSADDLLIDAVNEAIGSAQGIELADVDAFWLGTAVSGASGMTLSEPLKIANKPITRVEIEEIRGVKADRALQTLVAKQLIEEVGRAEAVGRPILYGTTKAFLDYFGLAGLHELPEVSLFQNPDDLEGETRMLFEKLEGRQLTIDDLDGSE